MTNNSQDWFRVLAETTSTAIFVYRERFLYGNRAFAELTGYSVGELLALEPLEIVHPDFRDLARERRDARLAGREVPQQYEMVILTKSGEERWVHYTGGLIRFDGEIAALGTAFDITDRKLAELALRTSEERLQLAQQAAGLVPWDWNLLTDELLILPGSVGFLGLDEATMPRNSGELLARVVHPEDASKVLAAARAALRGEGDYTVEHRVVSNDGAPRWLAARGHPIRDESGWVVRMVGVSADITERKLAELALQDSNERLRRERENASTTLASIDDGVIRTNTLGQIEYLNPVAERLLAVPASEAHGRALDEIYRVVDEDSKKPLPNPLSRCLREGRPVMLPGRRVVVARDGSEFVIRDSAAPIRGGDGQLLGAVLAFKDVTAVRDMERAMTHLANHDGLTGLLNRAAFERRLGHALETASVNGSPLALVQLDLGQLKVVNDTCGHWAGDEMVRQVARLLSHFSDNSGTLARLGAEEFGMFFESLPLEVARQKSEELRTILDAYQFSWEDRRFALRPAIGLVMAGSGDKVSALMIATDIACSLAKEGRRGRIHEYQTDDEELVERYREMHWIHRIYKALREDSFRLYCQPIRPLLEGEEVGLLGEVLLRMVGEDGELVLPRTFVPAAERYRLMALIDRWVVSKSFELLARRATVGGKEVARLAINLSGESLGDESFLDFVVAELERSKLSPHQILFEITETTAIANLPGAMRFIAELQEKGVDFVLDDFGSGLSSFAYLKNLPVNYLKVAGEFVRGLTDSPMHRTLVRSIHQIGHELGLRTIAEGVENPEMLAILEEIQLDYVQGFWIARPQPLLPG